jgi:GTP-binding protein
MFVDEHQITVRGGKGGDGVTTFRRESFAPRGGPDGGDGGDGGAVIFVASHHLNGLGHLQLLHEIRAEGGTNGKGTQKAGHKGKDRYVEVPVGTQIYVIHPPRKEAGARDAEHEPDDAEVNAADTAEDDEPEVDPAYTEEGASGEGPGEFDPTVSHTELFADLDQPGMEVIVARGGRGGFGNKHFASATNQTPREHSPGRPGQVRHLKLVVKLIADVGLLGLPNAGKSTLLARCTRARPKIAAYPFTTLSPYLGIVEMGPESRFVMADIPGLIEGASEGKGLGHQFLRHVERTRVLLHLLDASERTVEELKQDHDVIVGELEKFSPALAAKPRLLAVNKADVPGVAEKAEELAALLGREVLVLSGVSGQGLKPLLARIWTELKAQTPAPADSADE